MNADQCEMTLMLPFYLSLSCGKEDKNGAISSFL